MRPRARLIIGPLALLLAGLGGAAMPAYAVVPASCVVNSTGDQDNANPATPTTCEASAGIVTLRSAIELVSASNGTHTITFNLPSPSVITLTNGELHLGGPTTTGTIVDTITGPGARNLAIDGGGTTRVLHVNSSNGNGQSTLTANISGLTIRNGFDPSDPGAGIFMDSTLDTVNLDQMLITGNSAGGGAGIDHEGAALTVTNSTLSNNIITKTGNGECWAGSAIETNGGPSVTTSLTNDTFTGNVVDAACSTGGVINFCDPNQMTNVTIAGNTGKGGAITGTDCENSLQIKNSIIVKPTGSTNACDSSGIVDQGSNLSSDASCGFATGGTTHDLINTDPTLAALANNGGPTDTMALKAGSPAIDAVMNTCPPPSTDQRGLSRPQGSACDMGAFEYSPLKVTSVTASCGAIAGGGSVTINGSGFLGATQVTFGGRAAQSFSVVSDTQITAVAPAGSSGQKVDIAVTTPAGTSATGSPDQCSYATAAAVVPALPKAGTPPATPSHGALGWLMVGIIGLVALGGMAPARRRR